MPTEGGFDTLVVPDGSSSARSWYKKKRFVIPLGVVVLVALASAIPDTPTSPPIAIADSPVTSSAEPAAELTTKAVLPASTPSEAKVAAPTVTKSASPRRIAPQPKPKPTLAPKPKPKPKPKKTASRHCDPNYGGACVPIASDVDCASGSGNGPAYLSEEATVIGEDIYDLDRDNDGLACES